MGEKAHRFCVLNFSFVSVFVFRNKTQGEGKGEERGGGGKYVGNVATMTLSASFCIFLWKCDDVDLRFKDLLWCQYVFIETNIMKDKPWTGCEWTRT